jgi:hypothetical protein
MAGFDRVSERRNSGLCRQGTSCIAGGCVQPFSLPLLGALSSPFFLPLPPLPALKIPCEHQSLVHFPQHAADCAKQYSFPSTPPSFSHTHPLSPPLSSSVSVSHPLPLSPSSPLLAQTLRWLKNEARGPRLAKLFGGIAQEDPARRVQAAVGLFYVRFCACVLCRALAACACLGSSTFWVVVGVIAPRHAVVARSTCTLPMLTVCVCCSLPCMAVLLLWRCRCASRHRGFESLL